MQEKVILIKLTVGPGKPRVTTNRGLFIVGCLAGSFFTFMEKPSSALLLQKVGAGFLFAATILGWYMWFALILLSVNFPSSLPVGELSSVVPGRNNQAEMKNTKDA
ncbi:uncharacterized protein FFMR_02076 [Fusarium fujikuroi]|nr:uncharacterized protein FFMR_02076 [Fusarium fujikuroi]